MTNNAPAIHFFKRTLTNVVAIIAVTVIFGAKALETERHHSDGATAMIEAQSAFAARRN